MDFSWLKKFMPRGLYGRAALILLLPVVTIQLVVSVVFIQRHFEDVTRQMTSGLALELSVIQMEIASAISLEDARARVEYFAKPLKLQIELPVSLDGVADQRGFLDLSGRILIRTMHQKRAKVIAVDLVRDTRRVNLWFQTRYGPAQMSVSRQRVTVSNPHQFLVLMLFVSTLMTLVAFFYLRNQLRPIKRLARAADAFGKGRVVDYRPAGATEVRAAGRAFLDMRARIERHIDQRTLMLSGVSHDLRTPLTRLKLGLSLLAEDQEITDLISDINDMERLLDSFLDFSRGDALEEAQNIDPVELVRNVVENAKRAGGAVTLGPIIGTGEAMLRPLSVGRAVENLVGNALRYGDAAKVSIVLTEKSLKITVEDNGPGIAPDQRSAALRPFSRLEPARNQNRGSGVGLGLTIAHDVVRRHGGSLQLGDSADLGGLRVDLVLPRA